MPSAPAPSTATDPFDLQRFTSAQAPVYAQVRAELAAGRKASHWMWFIFPQLRGLGRSGMARHYGISGLEEAQAYWRHPQLGARLRECVALVQAVDGKTALQIMGAPDDVKLRSCISLFALAAPEEALFQQALDKYFGGEPDPQTLALLKQS